MKKLLWIGLIALPLFGQNFVPIHEIQSNRDSLNNSNYMSEIVTTTGIVISDVGAVAGSRNFYLEEKSGGPWSGIMCWFQNASMVLQLHEGDSVTVTGQVNEYYGNTEIIISDTADVIVHSTGNDLPPVAQIYVGYLDTTEASMYDPDSAEAYEGVLIQVSNVFVTDTAGPGGDWEITDGTGYALVRNNGNYTYQPHLGDNLNVRGIVRTYYGLYRIEPRHDDDIEAFIFRLSMAFPVDQDSLYVYFTTDVDPTSASNTSNYTLTGGLTVLSATVDPEDGKLVHLHTSNQTSGTLYKLYVNGIQDTSGNTVPENDSVSFYGGVMDIYTIQTDTVDSGRSAWEGRRVALTGIVTVDSTASSWYFIEKASGGPFSGLQIYDRSNKPLMGDSIVVVGTIAEYYLMTEMLDVLYIRIVDSGHDLPEPVVIETGDLSAGSPDGEQYESVIVKVPSAWVVNPNPAGSYWEIDDGSGICNVAARDNYSYEPHEGDTVGVTGVVRFVVGAFQIEPRGDYDIDIIWQSIGEGRSGELRGKPSLELSANPVTTKASVRYFLPERGKVRLSLYNVAGALVRRIRDGIGKAGVHDLEISVENMRSGVYFLRLETDRGSVTRKLIVR